MDKNEINKMKLNSEELKEIAGGVQGESFEIALAKAYANRIVREYSSHTIQENAEYLRYLLGPDGASLSQGTLEQIVRDAYFSYWGTPGKEVKAD